MNQKTYQDRVPALVGIMMVAILSIFSLAFANPSFAATAKKKAPAVERTSAVERTEARIKELQGALKISSDQEVLWNDLTLVMRENAKELDAISKDKSEITKTMDAVEAMKLHMQFTESRLAQQKRLIPIFEALYVSMTDEQKKVTDGIFRTGRYGKRTIK